MWVGGLCLFFNTRGCWYCVNTLLYAGMEWTSERALTLLLLLLLRLNLLLLNLLLNILLQVLLAGGLDMFYARFAPSTPYDMLPEEFQKQIILLAAVGVPVGVFVAHRVAVQKNLKTVWK